MGVNGGRKPAAERNYKDYEYYCTVPAKICKTEVGRVANEVTVLCKIGRRFAHRIGYTQPASTAYGSLANYSTPRKSSPNKQVQASPDSPAGGDYLFLILRPTSVFTLCLPSSPLHATKRTKSPLSSKQTSMQRVQNAQQRLLDTSMTPSLQNSSKSLIENHQSSIEVSPPNLGVHKGVQSR